MFVDYSGEPMEPPKHVESYTEHGIVSTKTNLYYVDSLRKDEFYELNGNLFFCDGQRLWSYRTIKDENKTLCELSGQSHDYSAKLPRNSKEVL